MNDAISTVSDTGFFEKGDLNPIFMAMDLPMPFWLCAIAILVFSVYGWFKRRQAWGLPMCAVLGTVGIWYLGDALYNNYSLYLEQFDADLLKSAWWQVLLFIGAYVFLVPIVNRSINRKLLDRKSHVISYVESRRLELPGVQSQITILSRVLAITWSVLMLIGLVRIQGDFIGLFAPYLGEKADPWGRARVGTGFDAFLSLASYFQIFLASTFGVIAAIAKNPRTRAIAIVICCLAFPYYIFDRVRNTMLTTMIPGLLAWVFFRLRGGIIVKVVVLAAAFMVVNYWMTFVIANRTDMSIASAFAHRDELDTNEKVKHGGMNMFEELVWLNYFIDQGLFEPNWGQRYFAELVNPIPRILWPGKPMIGIDYAIARGQGWDQASSAEGGVAATISTGMIGQGVNNFGPWLGTLAASLVLALWTSLVARQDLLGDDPGHMFLYGIGMIQTFVMGRDITLLALYPFFMGWIMLVLWKKYKNRKPGTKRRKSSSSKAENRMPRRLPESLSPH